MSSLRISKNDDGLYTINIILLAVPFRNIQGIQYQTQPNRKYMKRNVNPNLTLGLFRVY